MRETASTIEDKLVRRYLARQDPMIARWMGRVGVPVLRIGLGIVFLWFGMLKFFPGLSPAEDLVRETVYFVDPDFFLPLLAAWESLIGLGLIAGRFMRTTLLLLILHMPGTALPMILLPDVVWTHFPYGLTLEGQYIIKNLVLTGGALVLGGIVHGDQKCEDATTVDAARSPSGAGQ